MKKSRHTETRIIKVLKEGEADRLVKEVCREYDIPDATCYNWKAGYGGRETPGMKRLKEPGSGNRRLSTTMPSGAWTIRPSRILLKKCCKAGEKCH